MTCPFHIEYVYITILALPLEFTYSCHFLKKRLSVLRDHHAFTLLILALSGFSLTPLAAIVGFLLFLQADIVGFLLFLLADIVGFRLFRPVLSTCSLRLQSLLLSNALRAFVTPWNKHTGESNLIYRRTES